MAAKRLSHEDQIDEDNLLEKRKFKEKGNLQESFNN